MYKYSPFEYLDSLNVEYTLVPHTTAFTAQETAHSAHINAKDLAKVIVVGSAVQMSMVVVPANCILLQSDLSRVLKTPDLEIVPEHQFADKFYHCDIGAMPPFGKLYGMDVYIAKELSENQTITFNGGTHNILIKMNMNDFLSISGARVIQFGYRASHLIGRKAWSEIHNWKRVDI